MRLLILDDEEARHAAFRQRYPNEERVHVTNVGDAELALAAAQDAGRLFDLVFLDHDLGSGCLDGSAMVRWMAEHKPALAGEVIVHSANDPASRSMTATLRDAGYEVRRHPFHLLFPDWLKISPR